MLLKSVPYGYTTVYFQSSVLSATERTSLQEATQGTGVLHILYLFRMHSFLSENGLFGARVLAFQ